MNKMNKKKKIIISGGGTGGHIFPAISIANALKEQENDMEILFVGACDRMEMQLVPKAGYKIEGLPVMGLQRRLSLQNISFILKLIRSLRKAKKIIKSFQPDAVVGVGGYASGPVIRIATRYKIPSLIQEQNSYAGITNRLLAKRVDKICVAYDNMDKYFPKGKIEFTGNPVRQDILAPIDKKKALAKFGLVSDKKVVLILGGSLGARTINTSVINGLSKIAASEIQILWQTGKYYYEEAYEKVENMSVNQVKVNDFINNMDMAYAVADLVISRAGASTISELCLVGKPCVLVPSPNVAEDHQTKNALALVNKNAAVLVPDLDCENELIDRVLLLINDNETLSQLSDNISKLAVKDSAKRIANELFKLIK